MSKLLPLVLPLVLGVAACGGYPRDANDSTRRAKEHAMRVGVSHDPPFVVAPAGGREPTGSEIAMLRDLARTRDVDIEWVVSGHDALMRDLRALRLHAVVGGHVRGSAWEPEVGWSREYRLRSAGDGTPVARRLALPPGENAWQLTVDRYLFSNRAAPGAGQRR
ncbi:ABC transporter substrate-binding protein [Luteimonas suaedae]|uniref:ABC transporter substrate-binding protein n=1 Tax=Luteimonas suaedae TaxID=2605430 RepID=UPI0011ED86F5|nr:ABC transporter substrate-binding protein [Luteimonas suaedae]